MKKTSINILEAQAFLSEVYFKGMTLEEARLMLQSSSWSAKHGCHQPTIKRLINQRIEATVIESAAMRERIAINIRTEQEATAAAKKVFAELSDSQKNELVTKLAVGGKKKNISARKYAATLGFPDWFCSDSNRLRNFIRHEARDAA